MLPVMIMTKQNNRKKKRNLVKVDDWVVVKPDIKDPDLGIDISGWRGHVIEIRSYDNLLLLKWDKETQKQMSKKLIQRCKEKDLNWRVMYLLPSDVTPILSETGKREDGKLSAWFKGGTPKDFSAQYKSWFERLSKHLEFPFTAIVSGRKKVDDIQLDDRVRVVGLKQIHPQYGVMVVVRHRRKKRELPLSDLEVEDETSNNHNYIMSYLVWFSNRWRVGG